MVSPLRGFCFAGAGNPRATPAASGISSLRDCQGRNYYYILHWAFSILH